jgi:GPH family glycoside/pentoside/hexuronide:cation symporter
MSSSSEASPLLKQDFLKEEIIVLSPGPLDVVSDHLLLLNKGKPSEQLPAAVQSVHLSKTTKWLFGVGELGFYTTHMLTGFFLQTFLLEVARLEPSQTGTALLIGQTWSALCNPVIGQLSDNTNSRWGRRRPWILFAGLPLGIFYALLWQTIVMPADFKFLYYTVMFILFNTAQACVSVPYTSLTPELTPRYDERTFLTSTRFIYAFSFGLVASFVHSLLVTRFRDTSNPDLVDYTDGYLFSGILFGVLVVIPSLIVFAAVEERPPPPASNDPAMQQFHGFVGYLRGLVAMARNKAYIFVMLMFLFCGVALNMVQSNLFLYAKYVLKRESSFPFYMVAIQLSIAVSLFGWQAVARRVGKKITFYIGMIFWIAVEVAVFWNPGQYQVLNFLLISLAGLGVSVALLIPWSMLPDVIELDELKTGQRREGIFYSFFVVIQQLGVAAALSFSSYLLGITGYTAPYKQTAGSDTQPASAILTLKLLVGPIPAALLVISLLFAFLYPITKEKHQEIARLLEQKKTMPADEAQKVPTSP